MKFNMVIFSVFMLIGLAYSAPAPKADAIFAPVVPAPAVVTATSSQVIARNYNGIAAAAPFVAAPAIAPVAAPVVAAPYAAYPAYAPYVTYF
ncbi:calphotin-like isoform X2 [Planococcus citri]|uniref:calphotin-like isoform X2 n=1 Tax=Planococcus citri TaxID=170843 RepID=UPI0031FA438A